MEKEKIKELHPEYENVKSYYKKAHVKILYNKDGIVKKYQLISYQTIMLSIKNGLLKLNKTRTNYTNTTVRHLKEFIKQYNYLFYNYKTLYQKERITKKDILNLI